MGSSRLDIHQHITDQIVAMIENNRGAFMLPWHVPASSMRPTNVAAHKPYRGINILALWASAELAGYSSGLWATYKQWTDAGAQVRRGEKASYVVFYKEANPQTDHEPEDKTSTDSPGHAARRWIARASAVFAAEQVEGFEIPAAPASTLEPSIQAEAFVAATGAAIVHGGHRAFYRPATDTIHLPHLDAFVGSKSSTATEAYYSTLLHELTHWTGQESRCNRSLGRRFGKDAYAMEELVAELGAAFLCAELGVTGSPRADHGQYIAEWLSVLNSDKKAIFTAASQASIAVEFLRGLQPAETAVHDASAGEPETANAPALMEAAAC